MLAATLTAVLVAVGLYSAATMLVARYHTAGAPTQAPASQLSVAPPLSDDIDTPIVLADVIKAEPALSEVRIRIGTYQRSNQGRARPVLWNASGGEVECTFDLRGLKDNEYAQFKVKPGNYVGGRIEAVEGGGVSVYQAAFGPAVVSCVIGLTTDGREIRTAGCP